MLEEISTLVISLFVPFADKGAVDGSTEGIPVGYLQGRAPIRCMECNVIARSKSLAALLQTSTVMVAVSTAGTSLKSKPIYPR